MFNLQNGFNIKLSVVYIIGVIFKCVCVFVL